MTHQYILSYLIAYFVFLSVITWLTTRNSDGLSFYLGNKKSPWYLVAFGMIGTSISGVTFISVTGMVAIHKFAYLQLVFGFVLGYIFIALVLLPLYYRLNLTSIYTYLDLRFGKNSRQIGSFYFLIARTLGSAARLYMVAIVLDSLVFNKMNIPFWITVSIVLLLIFAYTVKGGVKTIVYTDTIQTVVMLIAVVICLYETQNLLGFSFGEVLQQAKQQGYTKIVTKGWLDFGKEFWSGVFICIGMTGLDQDLMQKNLSCKNIQEAQKNMLSFSAILVLVNVLFLTLGAFLALYIQQKGLHFNKADLAFGNIATEHFSLLGASVFVIGLVAISFASADSALTALTTSFCIDILNFSPSDSNKVQQRRWVHLGFTLLCIFLIIFLFKNAQDSVINIVYIIGSYTYGPLIGLYAFGLFSKRKIKDTVVPVLCTVIPFLIILASMYIGYTNLETDLSAIPNLLEKTQLLLSKGFGKEVIIYNGIATFLGLWSFSKHDLHFKKL